MDPAGVERWRRTLVWELGLIYGVLAANAFLLAPKFLEPLCSVPPNRYVPWNRNLECLALVANSFQTLWWGFLIATLLLAILAHQGKLDGVIRLMVLHLTAVGILVLAVTVSTGALPFWVQATYGDKAFQRIYD